MELVKVYTVSGELDAELIKSILDSEGIPAMVRLETYGRLLGGLLSNDVDILVRPDDAARAREILSEVRIEADILDDEDYEDE